MYTLAFARGRFGFGHPTREKESLRPPHVACDEVDAGRLKPPFAPVYLSKFARNDRSTP